MWRTKAVVGSGLVLGLLVVGASEALAGGHGVGCGGVPDDLCVEEISACKAELQMCVEVARTLAEQARACAEICKEARQDAGARAECRACREDIRKGGLDVEGCREEVRASELCQAAKECVRNAHPGH